ncbi:hypothetical protein Vafri_8274 [Volvox africanus]|nr:hypothetical protein Vafri_8274 [Volvox africanus]
MPSSLRADRTQEKPMVPSLLVYGSLESLAQGAEQPASATVRTATAATALADAAARLIALGEKPAPFCSPRDGRALRLVAPGHRLVHQELEAALTRVIQRRLDVGLEAQMHIARSNDKQGNKDNEGNKGNKGKGVARAELSCSSEIQAESVYAAMDLIIFRDIKMPDYLHSGQLTNRVAVRGPCQARCRLDSRPGPIPSWYAHNRVGLKGRAATLPVLPVHVASRALLAWLRGWAYLEAGVTTQALKDARAAVAYTAMATSRPCADGREAAPFTAVTTSDNGAEAAGSGDEAVSWWPSAQLLLAEVQMAAGAAPEQVVLSLLRAQNALAGAASPPTPTPPGLAATSSGSWVDVAASEGQEAAQMLLRRALEAEARMALEVAMRRLPEDSWEAVRDGGEMGLLQLLAQRAEERMPEFLRQRPRWYYYNAWMRQRLNAVCPGLPEPVTSKLLADTDANDLDLMLQHPLAIMAQAAEYTQVLQLYGEKALLSYKAEPLAWEEMQAMAGGGLVGLPLGYDAAKNARRYYSPETSDLGNGGGFSAGGYLTSGTSAATIRRPPDALTASINSLAIRAKVDGETEAVEREEGQQDPLLHHDSLVGPGAELAVRHCLRLALETLQKQAAEGLQRRLGRAETFCKAESRGPPVLREAHSDDGGSNCAGAHSGTGSDDADLGGRDDADARKTICMGQLRGRSDNSGSTGSGRFGANDGGGISPQTDGGDVCGTVTRADLGPGAVQVVRRHELVLLAARIATGTAQHSNSGYGLSGCEVSMLGGSTSGGTALEGREEARGLHEVQAVRTAEQPSGVTEAWKQTALPAGTPAPADLLLFELD